jgi:hypothetical protein
VVRRQCIGPAPGPRAPCSPAWVSGSSSRRGSGCGSPRWDREAPAAASTASPPAVVRAPVCAGATLRQVPCRRSHASHWTSFGTRCSQPEAHSVTKEGGEDAEAETGGERSAGARTVRVRPPPWTSLRCIARWWLRGDHMDVCCPGSPSELLLVGAVLRRGQVPCKPTPHNRDDEQLGLGCSLEMLGAGSVAPG